MKRAEFAAAVAGIAIFGLAARRSGASEGYQVTHSDAQWRTILGPNRYEILRQGGTEPAFSSALITETREGTYRCAGCSLALFSSKTKYDSGDGWPSFWTVLTNATRTQSDYALLDERTEVHCRRCGGHLGHIFDDGPAPTHLRYCIDGLALRFVPGAA
ncbi:MAG TPA: peptide-methionine (R)-S-oxide reductase MsrB [Candidatus Cybelea sp.]|jgi:peptide-methionine (R)-S-oxide reductase|nr:peptide-methionine (R)-S-oxide reductase MsrB [Candidatus Cybelea sp.]